MAPTCCVADVWDDDVAHDDAHMLVLQSLQARGAGRQAGRQAGGEGKGSGSRRQRATLATGQHCNACIVANGRQARRPAGRQAGRQAHGQAGGRAGTWAGRQAAHHSQQCKQRPTARRLPEWRGCPWRGGSAWAAGRPSAAAGRRGAGHTVARSAVEEQKPNAAALHSS